MSSLINKLQETVAFIKDKYPLRPQAGIVLGSGLGNFLSEISTEVSISYHDIPHFPVSTVEGHDGKMVFGELSGKKVVAMAGRFHYYEGYAPADVVYPIRVMKMLGIETLLLSNAAGGVNASFKVGDLMIINDHISMSVINPLIGKNEDGLGPRFPDMSEPYSKELIKKAQAIGGELGIPLQQGVYFGVTGPTFETHAEYRMIKLMGADAVGMSTVQEVIVAAHMELPVFAISVITDMGIREKEDDSIITHEEVLAAAKNAEPLLTSIFTQLVAKL
ncbi:MAG: purine-nucleoside phosphorylase [Chitinophagaceae bacterium]|nr:purine-nucleoside phosphorylase [Chitinophagaceae bacterium]